MVGTIRLIWTTSGRGRGVDPQGARGRPDGIAAVRRTHPAAVPRTCGQVRLAADRECRRDRPGDEGSNLGARRRHDHAGRGATTAAELAVPDLDLIKQEEQ